MEIVNKDELSLVDNNMLNERQLKILLSKTPTTYIKERVAKGGGKWKYVSGTYVRKVLNLMFGWNWDFEVIEHFIDSGEVVVKGRLSCRVNNTTIVKMQYGNKEIIKRRGSETPLSIGNDMKAAATDALKKCAAELGIASDVYAPEEFREIQIAEEVYLLEDIKAAYEIAKEKLSPADAASIKRIIENKEEKSYKKAWNKLQE